MSEEPRSLRNSQHELALSIMPEVRLDLPEAESEEAIAAWVEEAIAAEALRNERLLAGVRLAAVGVLLVLAVAAHLRPEVFGIATYPARPAVAAAAAFLVAAVLAALLRADVYPHALRRHAALLDAAIITAGALLFLTSLDGSGTASAASIGLITAARGR